MMILPHPVWLDPVTRMPWSDPRNTPALWTPRQRYIWEKATYTVPDTVSEERVQDTADKYRSKFGKTLEFQGFEVLGFDGPHLDRSVVAAGTTSPDRRRYVIWAEVRRRPVEVRVDVADEDIPIYEQAGFRHV